jgi:hypothetical protein
MSIIIQGLQYYKLQKFNMKHNELRVKRWSKQGLNPNFKTILKYLWMKNYSAVFG